MFYAATTPEGMGRVHHRTPHEKQKHERENNHQDTDKDIMPFFSKINCNHTSLLFITTTKIRDRYYIPHTPT